MRSPNVKDVLDESKRLWFQLRWALSSLEVCLSVGVQDILTAKARIRFTSGMCSRERFAVGACLRCYSFAAFSVIDASGFRAQEGCHGDGGASGIDQELAPHRC